MLDIVDISNVTGEKKTSLILNSWKGFLISRETISLPEERNEELHSIIIIRKSNDLTRLYLLLRVS